MYFHNEKPYYSTFAKSIKLFNGGNMELFLQASANSIESFYYVSPEKVDPKLLQEFSWMAQCLEGLSLEDGLKLSWQDLIDYDESGEYEQRMEEHKLSIICEPVYHLEKMLNEYMGIPKIENISSQKDEVVCYCFSVRKGEILSFLEENPHAKIFDLTNQLNVAGACQSCLSSVQDIMSSFSKEHFDYSSIDPDEVLLNLEKWDVLGSYFKMGLIHMGELKDNNLILRVKNPEKFDDMAWQVEDYLRDQIGALFVVQFEEL